MSKSAIISILSAILLVILAIQNSAATDLTLFFWKFGMPLSLLLLIMFLIGTCSGYFFHVAVSLRKKKAARMESETKQEMKTPNQF